MKTLIIYFTRTGTTRKMAEIIQEAIGPEAVLEEVKDGKDWSGSLGYVRAGRAALRKQAIEISDPINDPAGFDLVVIGTPVWAFTMAPAVRSYLERCSGKIGQAAIFTTQGGDKRQRVMEDMKSLIKSEIRAEEFFTTAEVNNDNYKHKLEPFLNKIKEVDK